MLSGVFYWGDSIDYQDLLRENEQDLSSTDITIAEEILQNGLDYDVSINDFANKCFTSRTSVLRFAKKLGFTGYSELKYYINDGKKDDYDGEKIGEGLLDLYEKIVACDRFFIYGNGGYEKIIKSTLKTYLQELGILAEVYSGGEEMSAFTEKMLKNSGVFIVDFNDNIYSRQLIFQIANIDCLKIVIGRTYDRASNVDYNIYFRDESKGIKKMSPYIKRLEEIFLVQREVNDDTNWLGKWKLW